MKTEKIKEHEHGRYIVCIVILLIMIITVVVGYITPLERKISQMSEQVCEEESEIVGVTLFDSDGVKHDYIKQCLKEKCEWRERE